MAQESASRRPLTRIYHDRIGETSATDEPTGYWLFALGLVLAGLGVLLSIPSTPGSILREWAVVLAASGLALLIAGPLIRLPLGHTASALIALDLLGCTVGIGWFTAVYPDAVASQATAVIGTYVVGVVVMGVGGILLPLTTSRAAGDRDAIEAELRALQRTLDRTNATDADLTQTLATVRERVSDADGSGRDRVQRTESRGGERDDADPDAVALATRLRTLHESEARFELYADNGGEYRWRLRHCHGGVIAASDGGYPHRESAQRRIQSVRRDALGATLLYYETAADLPATTEAFDPDGVEQGATIERYDAEPGVYRFRLRGPDGAVLADGGRGYATMGATRTAMERLQQYAGPADFVQFDSAGVELYRDQTGEWRWRLVHSSGAVLAESGEGYDSRGNAQRAVDRLRDTASEANFEVYEDNAGEYRWRVRTRDGRIVADSGGAHDDRDAAEEAVDRVRRHAPGAELLDVGLAAFEITADQDGDHRWRLRHRNGSVLAEGPRVYDADDHVFDAIDRVKRVAPGAHIQN